MAEPEGMNILPVRAAHPSPRTMNKLVKRLRAMTLALLPVEIDPEELNAPTSRIITPEVVASFQAAGGDYVEALPYALLRARQTFMYEANWNPADFGENLGRSTACEVLARRLTHLAPPERLNEIMSTRYRHVQRDGDVSSLSSVLELAIDQHCTIFLSSSEAQHVVNCLWRGEWIQVNNEQNDIDYVHYHEHKDHSIKGHFNASRLGVPRYQNFFRIMIWLFYLFVYSQAVRQPILIDNPRDEDLDVWEIILYTMALSFSVEEIHKVYETLRYFTYKAFGFWTVISLITDSLLVTAFVFRMIGLATPHSSFNYHFVSFQVLSFVSPFIWMKLVTVADGYKYVGTMQICVGRMLQESTIFFMLLSIMAFGFAQGLYALDAADGVSNHTMGVFNALMQALLGSPAFEGEATGGGSALGLYYLWNIATSIILLNILISLFSSAYQDVIDDAEAQYLAFFAGKTIGMIRAPDSFVYPAPFSLVEIFLVAPTELFVSKQAYATVNRYVMTFVFFVPLTFIALYESMIEVGASKNKYLRSWLATMEGYEGEEDNAEVRDPKVDQEYTDGDGTSERNGRNANERRMEISKVPFDELTSVFPNAGLSSEAVILNEIRSLKKQIEKLHGKLG